MDMWGWLVALGGSLVYILTLESSVSFWDCGEFIATSYTLQVGHPPGAPLYSLLAHCFMLMAGTNAEALAWWSNVLSAVSGGLTAMFLFWTIARLIPKSYSSTLIVSLTGTACYLFSDTAWFSAVESEVYSLSMLFSSVIVWAMVRWMQCDDSRYAPRWLLLVSFMMGLSVCVHQLSLLTIPTLVLIYFFKRKQQRIIHKSRDFNIQTILLLPLFFTLGLTPYLIIPIRAAADPPINMGNPSSWKDFKSYVSRDQYEKAPLVYGRCFNSPVVAIENGKPVYAPEMDMFFPRMWKHHANAELYYTDWSGRHGKMVRVGDKEYYKPSFGDNLVVFSAYQVGYMYLRYLMWNYSGRYNDRQGFGNLQNGQFITGIPFVDRLYVGTGAKMPQSMPHAGHNRYFLLPLLLGIIGLFSHFRRDSRGAWIVMTLFLMSSIVLSVYLNHPIYEPRERDYAYILSFYAFAIWIGIGADAIASIIRKVPVAGEVLQYLLCLVPLTMACQNWDDHDRSGRYITRDSAVNLLNSCGSGSILVTAGDNDTFPLWYVQQVEKLRTDVQVINISLLGSDSYATSVERELEKSENIDIRFSNKGPYGRLNEIIACSSRPIYLSQYMRDANKNRFAGNLKLCGIAYRIETSQVDSVDVEESYKLFTKYLKWHNVDKVYIDETSYGFLRQYWNDVLTVADNLLQCDEVSKAIDLLQSASQNIPVNIISDLPLRHRIAMHYAAAGDNKQSDAIIRQVRADLAEQLEYYDRLSSTMRGYIPYTLNPLLELAAKLD